MDIADRLAEDLKIALRQGDEDGKRTLRYLIAAMKNAKIEARGQLDEAAQIGVLRKQARQRRESMAEYERGNRPDLVAGEKAELDIIESYLPPELDAAAIEAAARRVIEAVGARGPADMGKVMPALLKELAGRADSKAVSEVARRLLAG